MAARRRAPGDGGCRHGQDDGDRIRATIIDRALQMLGGRGLERGSTLERLYREIRSLRIYEGATEVQQLIIGREVMK